MFLEKNVSNFPLILGGKETQRDVWKYNGALDKWIQIEPLITGRWRHKMAVHGGKLYALGGFDGVQRLDCVEAYDPFHNRWTQVNIIISYSSVTHYLHIKQQKIKQL